MAKKPTSALRYDPSRTGTLRKRFMAEVKRRFARLRSKVLTLVYIEDAFGLSPRKGVVVSNALVTNDRWRYNSDAEKLEFFKRWLRAQMNEDLLTGGTDDEWWAEYIYDGYMQGAGRAFDDINYFRKLVDTPDRNIVDFYDGSRSQFLETAFGQPVAQARVDALASRVFTELEGITDDMSLRVTRALTDGLVQGLNPRDVARELVDTVDGISLDRALTMARTEIIRAHAEGQLDSMEEQGLEEVGVMVEWSTSHDSAVCPKCAALEGVVMKIEEARGLIPRHPNCRCAMIPANVGEDKKGQVRGKSAIDEAFDESLGLDGGRENSNWFGADTDITKARPRSILDL